MRSVRRPSMFDPPALSRRHFLGAAGAIGLTGVFGAGRRAPPWRRTATASSRSTGRSWAPTQGRTPPEPG
ncbi:twin-arginine translocation signal domain-containing protein [Streptomyces sp. NPDC096310]|uniref:twin-arginine translocation signal domain-containing protein n=1 Tax=Streptomyces sp. NPDC096310 TaxID=3366082 RepID=UPI003808E5C9